MSNEEVENSTYRLITCDSKGGINREVTMLMDAGWTLVGGGSVVVGGLGLIYCQSLTRYEGETDKTEKTEAEGE